MLITGGLLALGILSMLGAILLARGGSSEKPTSEARVGRTLVEPASTSPAAIAAPTTQREVIEHAGEVQVLEQLLRMNEQFHELADRLEAIHERSIAIEQRLDRISAQVERIEKV
jgi:DNA-binding IclR family transcriptional regulator